MRPLERSGSFVQLLQGLLAGGGDTGGPQHVGVGGGVLHQLDGDVAAEAGLEVSAGVSVTAGVLPSASLGRRPLYGAATDTGASLPRAPLR